MTIQTQAEQFLARNGIKFRVVQSERGPGEWNVTFSRKGGGRLKLDYLQDEQPTAAHVLRTMIRHLPDKRVKALTYGEDVMEYKHVRQFFTDGEMLWLNRHD